MKPSGNVYRSPHLGVQASYYGTRLVGLSWYNQDSGLAFAERYGENKALSGVFGA
jgi:hypothetical protein